MFANKIALFCCLYIIMGSVLLCFAGCTFRKITVRDVDSGKPIQGALVGIYSNEFLEIGKRQVIYETDANGMVYTKINGLATIACGKIGYWPAFDWANNREISLELRLWNIEHHDLEEYRRACNPPAWLMFSRNHIPYKEKLFPQTLEYSYWLFEQGFYCNYPLKSKTILEELFHKYKEIMPVFVKKSKKSCQSL